MVELVIKLNQVSKKYVLRHEKPTLVENILGRRTSEIYWALRNLNLTITKGEKVGIIGVNGSGKTTLLRIIGGITAPTGGKVEVRGKVVSLIELGAGFHPDLTGEENIYLNGLLIGMSKEKIKKELKKIIKFAGLGKFIDAPFYTYSSGMRLRLGFSVAVYSNPDILLLDENIAVGDADFKRKSLVKIKEFIKKGKTVLMASHLLEMIEHNCSRVIWLDKGKIKEDGRASEVIKQYEKKVLS